LELAEERGLEVDTILKTHAHVDHVGGLKYMKSRTDAAIYLHPGELELYRAAPQQGRMFEIAIQKLPEPDEFLEEGDRVGVRNCAARILHLPRPSPGGIGFYFEEQSIIFSGDVLVAGSIGCVDLPGADPDAMEDFLARLAELPDETRVVSGHGPETTIGDEKSRNPYL
jgi:glyoxylase-like metal-dependent hydrolase (beta-lactamase superfamily II)